MTDIIWLIQVPNGSRVEEADRRLAEAVAEGDAPRGDEVPR